MMAYGQYESDNLERNKQLYKWCPARRRRRRRTRHDEGGKRFVQMTRRLLSLSLFPSSLRAREQISGSSFSRVAAHTYIVRRRR